jgi:predicted phosphodiesterase
MGQTKIFSWLHISDIHFGHGDQAHRWSQHHLTDALLADLKSSFEDDPTESRHDAVPRPDAVLVTGDVAFKGAADEYDLAKNWLLKLAETAGLTNRDIFLIPGNHDIQRTQTGERQAFRLIRDLRERGDLLDPALEDIADRIIVTRRLENYLRFASDFAPACLDVVSEPEQWLFWSHHIQPRPDVNVRIHLLGLNSAMLCNDDKDKGKLQLGAKQLETLSAAKPLHEVRIVLTHHPLEELIDATTEHVVSIRTTADIHLFGHVHNPVFQLTRYGATEDAVRIVAGAIHGDPGNREEAYHFASIIQMDDGNLELRVWPRRWVPEQNGFAPDQKLLKGSATYTSLPLAKTKASKTSLSAAAILKPLLPQLPRAQFSPIKSRQSVIDPPGARHWLSIARLNERSKMLEGSLDPGENLTWAPPAANDEWKTSLIDNIRMTVGNARSAILLHGIRGVGKSILLLRYVAAAPPTESRIFVDYGALEDRTPDDLASELQSYLQGVSANTPLFIAVDGLDIACRQQAVRTGNPLAESMLAFHTRGLLAALAEHQAFIVLTADDPPSNDGGDSAEDWATKSLKEILTETFLKREANLQTVSPRISFRLLPPTGAGDLVVRSNLVPMIAPIDKLWTKFPYLQLPVFFDALREAPFGVLQFTTRREFLSMGAKRATALGARRHVYFKTLDDIATFINALEDLPVDLKKEPRAASCLSLIEKEITGDWEYLLEIPEALVHRLEQLHSWLIEERWRFSSTYALSNVVTLLSRFHRFKPAKMIYSHCNLRNAQMEQANMAGTRFHGVDLSGATITDAVLDDTWFYGVDLTRAKLDRSTISGDSRFVGCRSADQALTNAKSGPRVRNVEQFIDGN